MQSGFCGTYSVYHWGRGEIQGRKKAVQLVVQFRHRIPNVRTILSNLFFYPENGSSRCLQTPVKIYQTAAHTFPSNRYKIIITIIIIIIKLMQVESTLHVKSDLHDLFRLVGCRFSGNTGRSLLGNTFQPVPTGDLGCDVFSRFVMFIAVSNEPAASFRPIHCSTEAMITICLAMASLVAEGSSQMMDIDHATRSHISENLTFKE
jgi:hypothetical protein